MSSERNSTGTIRRAIVVAVVCTIAVVAGGLAAAGVASAAPIVDYAVPGANEAIIRIVPGQSGSVWFVQNVIEQPENATSRFRVGRMSDAGTLEALSAEIPGKADFTQLAGASDGGLWVLGAANGQLVHVSSDAKEITNIPLPGNGVSAAIVNGADGRAWVLRCNYTGLNEACAVNAATTTGTVTSYQTPSLNYEPPPGETGSSYLDPHGAVTAAGVWFGKTMRTKAGADPGAAFVTYGGEVTAVPLPASAELLGSAGGENVWWEVFEGTSVTVGELSPSGQTSNTHNRPASFEFPNSYANDPGRNGDLVWSDNTPWSTTQTGRLGVYHPSGASSEYVVPEFAVTVPLEPSFWSGACSFANFLYEATNGSIWAVSGGHPDMLSDQQPSGAFSTFLPVSGVPHELGIEPPAESTTGALWFAVDTTNGEEMLARANPLEPPPGLPPYPGGGLAGQSSQPAPSSPSAASASARISRALQLVHVALSGLRRHHEARVRIDLPFPGSATLRLYTRVKRHLVILGTGHASRSTAGVVNAELRLNRRGKSEFAHHRRMHVTLVITMTTARGVASRSISLTL